MRPLPNQAFNVGRSPMMSGGIKSIATSSPIVFVVAENPFAGAMAAILGDMDWQVREIPSVDAFLLEPEYGVPSCLVLDALAVPECLANERAHTPVICVAGSADVLATVQVMKAGAVDVLVKPLRPETMIMAIELAFERSNQLMLQVREERALRDRYASLSQRERQVMSLVVSGLLNKQVGGELGISEITVKAHRGKVMRKMNARTFVALVNMAGKLKLEPYVECSNVRQVQLDSLTASSHCRFAGRLSGGRTRIAEDARILFTGRTGLRACCVSDVSWRHLRRRKQPISYIA